MTRFAIAVTSMLFLSGCMTVTGTPREEHVIYPDDGSDDASYALSDSITVGEMSEFMGTSIITLSFKTNPNLDNDDFRDYLSQSLEHAGLLGEGYVLNAQLLDSDNFPLGFKDALAMGDVSRNIIIKYTLVNANGETVFAEVIEGDGSLYNGNFFRPYHLIEREAAEKGYGDNIRQLIERLRAHEG